MPSPLPRWGRFRILPQANTLCLGFLLREFILPSVLRRLLIRVFAIPPSQPNGDLGMTGIQRHGAGRAIRRLNPHLADDALVAVAFGPFDAHLFVEDHPGEILLRPLAEGLGLLWCVNTAEANLVLLAIGI